MSYEQSGVILVLNNERDQEILALRSEGFRLEEIGERFGLTRERVRQIVKDGGGVTALEARTVRAEVGANQLKTEAAAVLARFGSAIRTMAAAGATRDDVEVVFGVVCPEIDRQALLEAINAANVHFNVVVLDVHFSVAAIEAAAWYAAGISNDVDGDVSGALPFLDAALATELSGLLTELGLGANECSAVLRVIGTARARVARGDALSISKKRYDEVRTRFIKTHGLASAKGAIWPPTGQTAMKRLERGYWTTAIESIGLQPETGGRERGLLVFQDDAYEAAVTDFMSFAAAQGTKPTFAEYKRFVEIEDRSRRRRPSGAAVRLKFGSWTDAKRAGQAVLEPWG